VGLQAALGPRPRLQVAPHHAVFLEAFDAALQLRSRLELQGRPGSDRHRAYQGAHRRERRDEIAPCEGADRLSPRLDDYSVDASREPRDLRGR
jgi:hypothetical protein